MIITNYSKLPLAIERAVVNDPYDSSGSDISTTRLIAPLNCCPSKKTSK